MNDGTARAHAVTLTLLAACCAGRWLADLLLEGSLWMPAGGRDHGPGGPLVRGRAGRRRGRRGHGGDDPPGGDAGMTPWPRRRLAVTARAGRR
jgi:hypothetical protein